MAQNQEKPQDAAPRQPAPTGKNALEWLIFGLSMVLLLAIFGWLVSQLGQNSLPPRLEITLGEPVKAGKRVLVPVEIQNRGDAAASSVEIEVERRGGQETAGVTFGQVPRRGRREGWVAFDAPLEKRELSAKIVGYEES